MKILKDLEYVRVEKIVGSIIIFDELDEFLKIIKQKKPKTIFIAKKIKNKLKPCFSFSDNDVFYSMRSRNYENIEDCVDGKKKGFVNGAEYYEAKNQGYSRSLNARIPKSKWDSCLSPAVSSHHLPQGQEQSASLEAIQAEDRSEIDRDQDLFQ